MPIVEINDLARVGQVNDIAPYMLPPEAWTLAENIRYSKGSPQVLDGWAQVFGTPAVEPHFAMSVKGSSQTWWLYMSLTAGGGYDGTGHFNTTRSVGGPYTTNTTEQWNGVVFGGIPIFNNGMDVPQAWIGVYSTILDLVNLPNWPSGMRAAILRNFGSYLVAFNITDPLTTGADGGHIFPHLVQWSNPAQPGSVPTSWAYGDPTTEGGRKDMPDTNSGFILEAMQLGSTMFIYKERSIWKMNFIGGTFIFQFDTFLADVGILAPRCVCMDITGTKHVVVTQDDIIVHNGNSTESVLTDRQRVTLFGTLNRDAVNTCFMFTNKAKDEVWFCYPESGQLQPSRALIWNAKGGKGAISFATGINFRNATVGDLQGVSSELWNPLSTTTPATWDTATITNVTLSGSNLVATNTGTTSADQGARIAPASGKTRGKYYFECTFTTSNTSPNMGIGVGTTTSTYSGMGTDGTTGVILRQGGNVFSVGGLIGVGFSGMVSGARADVAVDLDNRLIWFRRNGGDWNANATYSPVTKVGGITIPPGTMVPIVTFGGSGGVSGNVFTTNFGATTFVGAVPAGFESGWTVGSDSDDLVNTWDVEDGPWSQIFKQRLVLCAPDPTRLLTYANFRFYQLDSGTSRDIGPPAAPVLAREDLGIIGQKRSGELINDFKQMKMVDSVWPKLTGAAIRLRVGFREVVNGNLTWQDYTTFNPATDLWVNTIVNETLPGCGKAVSIEFSASDLAAWRLDGYSMNIEVIGPY